MGHYSGDARPSGSRAKHAQSEILEAHGKVPRHTQPAVHTCPEIAWDVMTFIREENFSLLRQAHLAIVNHS